MCSITRRTRLIHPCLRSSRAGSLRLLLSNGVGIHATQKKSARRVGLAQPLEPRPQLLVVDRYLTVEHQGARGQLGDRGRDAGEASRVVAAAAADEAHTRAVFVREDAPAVDLLLVGPAVAVKGLADERRAIGV